MVAQEERLLSDHKLKKEHPHPTKVSVLGGLCLKGPEVDKILLALLVAVTGSLVLPPMRLARVFMPRRAGQASTGRETNSEVKEQIDHVPLAPARRVRGFEFRPLTAEEKKEIENSLGAKRKTGAAEAEKWLRARARRAR